MQALSTRCAVKPWRAVADVPAMETSEKPAPRRSLQPPLRVESLSAPELGPRFLGYAANLSETGLFVQCSNPKPPGTRMELRLHASRGCDAATLCCEAEVRWSRGYGGKRAPTPGMGLQFLNLDDLVRAQLRAIGAEPTLETFRRIDIRP